MLEWLQFIQYGALQIVRELMKEASRSGKTIEQLLVEAERETTINREKADALLELLRSKN